MVCLTAQQATAQNIPDPYFADAIYYACPSCIDLNNNLTAAAQNLDSLDVSGAGISSLAGIAGFTGLQFLRWSACQFCRKDCIF